MMLLLNTLQQPSRTMTLHLVKIPLLMLLLTGLLFFFFNFFPTPPDQWLDRTQYKIDFFFPFSVFFLIKKSSSLSHVVCRSQWSRFQAEFFVFNWYKQVESSLHRYFQVRIASANPHRVDSPPFFLSFCVSNVVIFTIFFSSSVFLLFHSSFIAIAHCHLLFAKSWFLFYLPNFSFFSFASWNISILLCLSYSEICNFVLFT